MQKLTYIILIALTVILTAATQIPEECDSRALKAELKLKLKPDFKYDSSKTSRFTYKSKEQVKEIEVPLYMGEKYRFLFNTAGLKREVKVEIYNKPRGHKKRKLIYEIVPTEGEYIYIFEPEKSRKMYITYTTAAVEEDDLRGCLVFLVGYRAKL